MNSMDVLTRKRYKYYMTYFYILCVAFVQIKWRKLVNSLFSSLYTKQVNGYDVNIACFRMIAN